MMHVDVKGVLCQSALGMRAAWDVDVRWDIQNGKDSSKRIERRSRAMVVGVRIVDAEDVCEEGEAGRRYDAADPIDFAADFVEHSERRDFGCLEFRERPEGGDSGG
jgi:hypothetical protein